MRWPSEEEYILKSFSKWYSCAMAKYGYTLFLEILFVHMPSWSSAFPEGRRCRHTLAKFGLAPHPWQLDIYHSTLDILFAKFQIANTQHSISNFQLFGQRVFLVQILLSHCPLDTPAHRSRWNATLQWQRSTLEGERPREPACGIAEETKKRAKSWRARRFIRNSKTRNKCKLMY